MVYENLLVECPWPQSILPGNLKGQQLTKPQKWYLAQQLCLHNKSTKQLMEEHNLNQRTLRYYRLQYIKRMPTYKSRGRPRSINIQIVNDIVAELANTTVNDKLLRSKITEKHKEQWRPQHRNDKKPYRKLSYRTIARYMRLIKSLATKHKQIDHDDLLLPSKTYSSQIDNVIHESNIISDETIQQDNHSLPKRKMSHAVDEEEHNSATVYSISTGIWNTIVGLFEK